MVAETSAIATETRLFPESIENTNSGRGSLRNHILNLYGEQTFKQTRRLSHLRIVRAKRLSQLAFLQRCRDSHVIPKFLLLRHHIKTPAAQRIFQRTSEQLLRERIHHSRYELASIERELYNLHLNLSSAMRPDDWDTLDSLSFNNAERCGDSARDQQVRKFSNLQRVKVSCETHVLRNTVINLTEENLDTATTSVLSRGLNFAVAPKRIPTDDVIAAVETAVRSLPEDAAEDIRRDTSTILARAIPPRCNISREERLAIRQLKQRDDMVILPADKGNATVVMKSADYHSKMTNILSDGDTYRKLDKNPLPKVRQKVMSIIGETTSITEEDRRRLKLANNNRTPRIYGLPKIHKPDVPLRPIVSAINSPSQHLARFLANKLKPLTNNLPSAVLNSKHFIERIRDMRTSPRDILVSFDVTSLFTMVPVSDAIRVLEDNLGIHQLPTEWAKLAEVCLSTTFFQYKQEFYAQTDGIAMGSPLSPVVANLFMGAFEEQALENAPLKPTIWLRYVDDTFVIWPHGPESLQAFLAHLNSIHPRIQFTMETERHGQLPFLDVLVSRRPDGTLGHSVYRKPTHTNRYLHADSHHHPATKRGVLTTLTHRAALICDSNSLKREKETLRETFLANGYSRSSIQRALKNLDADGVRAPQTTSETPSPPRKTARLPYIQGVTDRIGRLLRKADIRPVFYAHNKIGRSLVQVKDRLDPRDNAGVYEIPCSCGLVYIGQTGRSVDERMREHMRHDRLKNTQKSALALHAAETGHLIDFNKTRSLSSENRWWPRVIKEALEISRRPINLNRDDGLRLSTTWKRAFSTRQSGASTGGHTPTVDQ